MEAWMDRARARELLGGERARLERLLAADTGGANQSDGVEDGVGDEVDNADRRVTEETGAAVSQLVQARWAALERAERRLAAGSYGRSVRGGEPIPDERLEADPLAELTVEEEAAGESASADESDTVYGLRSARYPFKVRDDADITPEEQLADEEDDDEPAPEPPPGFHTERGGPQ